MRVYAEIDCVALRHNVSQVASLAPNSRVLAMVKANGYGHGLIEVASVLRHDADALGVARIEEALRLRRAGIDCPLVLAEGFTQAEELPLLVTENLETVVHQSWQVEMLERANLLTPVKVWLKIDTGMHRLGFNPEQVPAIWQRLAFCPSVQPDLGLMTHFAQAEIKTNDQTLQQIASFDAVTATLLGPHSLANSAAILGWPETHRDWVRPGIMLYGISPYPETTGLDFDLRPVMTLHSEIIALREVAAGEPIGYGATWHCPCNSLIGVVAMGYGDGYPRYIQNGAPVWVNGGIVPLVGRVSMDMLTVDLTERLDVKIGDKVVLWGEGLPVEWVAKAANTSPYELVCGVTERINRRIL